MLDGKPNSTYPRWVQNLAGGISLAALLTLAAAWGALGERVEDVEEDIKVVAQTKEQVAVVQNEVKNIKEDLTEVKRDVKEVLKQLQEINGGGQ